MDTMFQQSSLPFDMAPSASNYDCDAWVNNIEDIEPFLKDPAPFTQEQLQFLGYDEATNCLAPVDTVAPRDLMMNHAATHLAVPGSNTTTNRSTPSLGSPACFSDPSPALTALTDFGTTYEHGLFHGVSCVHPTCEESVTVEAPKQTAPAAPPAPQATPAPPASPAPPAATPMARVQSAPNTSPAGRSAARPSSVSGVKSRNRSKPLKPIVYDENDPAAVKRAKNTQAARKSRRLRTENTAKMEATIIELEKQLAEALKREAHWKAMAEAMQ